MFNSYDLVIGVQKSGNFGHFSFDTVQKFAVMKAGCVILKVKDTSYNYSTAQMLPIPSILPSRVTKKMTNFWELYYD